MKTILWVLVFTCTIFAQYTGLVDPFIGTGGHGHTFPGATTPFGMVQLSPDTDTQGWDWCSGYHFSDNSIIGFSHTHLSGTGGADYGDILLMPFTGKVKWSPGPKNNPDAGYRSRFSHEKENAHPGYYQVFLEDYKINVELTATARAGFHKYSFTETVTAGVMLDLAHGISDRVRIANFEIINDHEIRGLRRSKGWADDQYVYFHIVFSKPFKSYKALIDKKENNAASGEGKSVKVVLFFDLSDGNEVLAKVGISAVSTEGAKKNLFDEIDHWDFKKIQQQADKSWNEWLAKIKVSGGSNDENTIFYTALYHALLAPNLYMDVDGKYRGRDLAIHQTKEMNYYTLFSLWDTFRATHPLFTLIAPEHNRDFIKTMLIQFDQGGDLPIWELAANETGTMIGYHSVPVIVDAFMKGQADFDIKKALKAMKHSSMRDYRGLKHYRKLGYIPSDKEVNSVSKCLEYAYDDWCIAQMAKKMGQVDDYKTYIKRSQNYLNHFNTETAFMRGRMASGLWRTPFDPREVSHLGNADFTEGNSWQYTFFVPHNVNHLIELIGGDAAFNKKLDDLFSESKVFGLERSPDVSGLIGNYAHGNEPSHHIAYLYNYSGQSWKTQQIVDRIKTEMYKTGPEGLPGNEDCGQMSAWYVFSAMGFYPVNPGQNQYVIGSPSFKEVNIDLGSGKTFTIKSNKAKTTDIFIQKLKYNNKEYKYNFIEHSDLYKDAQLEFIMSAKPNKTWGRNLSDRVKSIEIEKELKIKRVENSHAMMPYFADEEDLFSNEKTISLSSITPDAAIYYTLDGTTPDKNSIRYKGPFNLSETTTVNARAYKDGFQPSFIYSKKFIKVNFKGFENIDLTLKNPPSIRYNKGGKYALIDKNLGSMNFSDGKWLGFEGTDLEATIDLGKRYDLKDIQVRFFKGHGAWIFLPKNIQVLSSEDGESFNLIAKQELQLPKDFEDDEIKAVTLNLNKNTRYLKLIAKNLGKNPKWHGTPDGKCWLFVDEILISGQ